MLASSLTPRNSSAWHNLKGCVVQTNTAWILPSLIYARLSPRMLNLTLSQFGLNCYVKCWCLSIQSFPLLSVINLCLWYQEYSSGRYYLQQRYQTDRIYRREFYWYYCGTFHRRRNDLIGWVLKVDLWCK